MSHEPIHHMFRRAAERFGGHTALEWQSYEVTYRQLDLAVQDLAEKLRESGAGPGARIGILTQGTANVVASILATLEVGGVFVPLDPNFSTISLPAVVEEARPGWWLATSDQFPALSPLGYDDGPAPEILMLDELWRGSPEEAKSFPAPVPADPDSSCYIYFTSGSTGRPKGIVGRLKAIDHFIRWEVEAFGIGEGTRVSQLVSPAFDAFLRDVFVPLVAGGTVCVPDGIETLLDGARLAEWLDERRVNLVHCTPSLLRSMLGQDLDPSRFQELRHVLLAGEPLLPSDVKRWHGLFGERIQLVNLYGPSETTMVKLFYPVKPGDGDARTIPIGQPMPGARALVIDEETKPCPPGKLGEIWIRTPYRSLGYLDRPELTDQVFVRNPWSDRPDDLIYRTGDLGRVREDGNFEFVGRRDQQVKVRGVRIELSPIEELLRAHEAVVEAAVIDRVDLQGNRFLCAYVVPRAEVDSAQLADFLRERLPETSVPSAFVTLAALPRTLSGKVDRRSLPSPGEGGWKSGREYVEPRTPVEEGLCALFSELLGTPKVGIHDSFFELGGHSLLATLLLSRVRAAFAVEVPLRQVFQTPTVEALALAVTRAQLEQESEGDIAALLDEIERGSQV